MTTAACCQGGTAAVTPGGPCRVLLGSPCHPVAPCGALLGGPCNPGVGIMPDRGSLEVRLSPNDMCGGGSPMFW